MAYTDVEKLASLRVSKKSDNTDVKPVDLLRAAVYAIETGADAPTSVIILTREIGEDNSIITGSWRCGIRREEELCLYIFAQDHLIQKMRKGQ
jgi:hypothetical protein